MGAHQGKETSVALILTDLKDNIGTLTFNNDEKRNALSRAFINEMNKGLNDLIYRQARVVILRAARGARVWSAGYDINELPHPGRDPLSYNDPLEQAIRSIQKLPAPVIAMIEGGVWGGACEMALVCDLIIAGPSATFAITPAKIGIPYNPTGILHVLNILGLNLAKEMFFTAQPIAATRAAALGIINHLVPAEELEEFTYNLAAQICANSPISIGVIKEELRILANALPLSPETLERIQGLRRLVYDSKDYQEGKSAFLEKRKPNFQGE